MKFQYVILSATLTFLSVRASTETENTATNCLLEVNPYLENIKRVQDVLSGHLESPKIKFSDGKAYNDEKERILKSLTDCINNSERPFDVLSDAQRAAINPATKETLQEISNRMYLKHYLKVTGLTVLIGGGLGTTLGVIVTFASSKK